MVKDTLQWCSYKEGHWTSTANFPPSKQGENGEYCRACFTLYHAKYMKDNPVVIEQHLNLTLKWKKTHLDSVRKANIKWKRANYKLDREYTKKWILANPERYQELKRLGNQNYNTRKEENGGLITSKQYDQLVEILGFKCTYPGCNLPITKNNPLCLDHIVANATGGPFTVMNIQFLCRSHNSSKGIKFIDYRTKDQIKLLRRIK